MIPCREWVLTGLECSRDSHCPYKHEEGAKNSNPLAVLAMAAGIECQRGEGGRECTQPGCPYQHPKKCLERLLWARLRESNPLCWGHVISGRTCSEGYEPTSGCRFRHTPGTEDTDIPAVVQAAEKAAPCEQRCVAGCEAEGCPFTADGSCWRGQECDPGCSAVGGCTSFECPFTAARRSAVNNFGQHMGSSFAVGSNSQELQALVQHGFVVAPDDPDQPGGAPGLSEAMNDGWEIHAQ
jgi:hypothetical protein